MLENAPTFAIGGVDTAENEPSKVGQVMSRISANLGSQATRCSSALLRSSCGPRRSAPHCGWFRLLLRKVFFCASHTLALLRAGTKSRALPLSERKRLVICISLQEETREPASYTKRSGTRTSARSRIGFTSSSAGLSFHVSMVLPYKVSLIYQ